jgi:oligopeptidase B
VGERSGSPGRHGGPGPAVPRVTLLFLLAILPLCAAPQLWDVAARPPPAASRPALAAPIAKREPHRSAIHGTPRADDYFWLREKDTPAVLEYLEAENAYTEQMTQPQAPLRKTLYDEMLARVQQNDVSVPFRKDGFWYYERHEEAKQYPILCRKQGSLDAREEILLDLNAMLGNERFIRLSDWSVSDDGNRLAYATDFSGFREYTLRLKDLRSGKELPDTIENVSSFAWAADSETLLYVTEDAAKRPYKLWRHRLGTDPRRDPLIHEEKDERFVAQIERTRSEAYLLLNLASHTTREVRWAPASRPGAAWKTIARRQQDHEYYADHRGDRFYIRTNDRGRGFRLVTAPVSNPARENWKEEIAHRTDVMLDGIDLFKDHYVIRTRSAALPHLEVRAYGAKKGEEIGFDEATYSAFPDANPEFDTQIYRFSYTSFVTPFSVYAYDVKSSATQLLKRQNVLGGYDPSRYTSERIWASAADGTQVPISLIHRKGLVQDGRAPLLLSGYGAYGIPSFVGFSSERVSLLDRGVVFAVAHIRGGGELGTTWHDQGRMMTKRNSFSDFIACAEHLVQAGYTAPERLAIEGRSAGGLLIGAVVNMRPELFRVALADVPFVDIINTMLDESLPLTVGEFEEWGNPKRKPEYDYMMTYSPYDNVARQPYPAMLVESSYNDSQVMYFEPAKWVARLRAHKTDSNPLLLKMELAPAGHGGKSGRYERLEQQAFTYAFLLSELGIAK